jgi:hypothetical protein
LRSLALLVLPLLLSGCLRYDLTLRFDHQTHGEIQQTIALSDRGAALAQPTLAPWLAILKARSHPLGGHLSQAPPTTTLTVPFGTAADLSDRFQQLFATPDASGQENHSDLPLPTPGSPPRLQLPGWGTVPFDLAIDQTNWLLISRTHLTYTLDLQELPTNQTDSAADPWADLHFRLQVPWGLAHISPAATPPTVQDATGATWQLQPGHITRIDAVFWLPNVLAIGTLGIIALVLAGYGLRYRILNPKFPTPRH